MEDKVYKTAVYKKARCIEKKIKYGLLVGIEIATVRKALGVTQEFLSLKLNLTWKTLSNYEYDKCIQSYTTDKKIREIIASPAYKMLKELNFQKSVCVNQIINAVEM